MKYKRIKNPFEKEGFLLLYSSINDFLMQNELALFIKKMLVIFLFIALWYALYSVSSILLIILISGFITMLINPLAEKGEKYHIPAWVTVIWVYIIIFLLWSIVIGTLIPIIIDYLSDTATLVIQWVNNAQIIYLKEGISGFHFHPYAEKIILFVFGEKNIEHTLDIIKQNAWNIQAILTNQIWSITSGGISVVSAVGWAVANWTLVAITVFMMVLERKTIGNFILEISPTSLDKYLRKHYTQIQNICTAWMRATLILSWSIFLTTYVGLSLVEWIFDFNTNRTFTLAIIWWIMEFIPYVWPLIALIPAVIIGLGISWKVAGIITILYLIIQQIENNFLVPYVMSKSLNLSPFLVFIVMLAGASLGGIIGIILAIPIAWVVRVIYTEHRKRTSIKENIVTEE
jgi:predicted PurR-regulated permease PerM